jgi:hypothetical protein
MEMKEAFMRKPVAVAFLAALTAVGAYAKPVEHLTAFAVDMSNLAGRTKAGTIDIVIDRWSTAAERDRLLAALKEGGTDALLRALQKVKDPAGYIRDPASVGYPLRFAWRVPMPDGGERIIVATDRPVSFLEATSGARTMDYPFMLIDVRLGPDGKGQGKLIPLAKIAVDEEHVVEIENYASEPVRLTEVRRVD